MNPKEAFDKTFNGKRNIFTPNVIEYFSGKNIFVELSKSNDNPNDLFFGKFGVTVINKDLTENFKLSELCHSENSARSYIKEILHFNDHE